MFLLAIRGHISQSPLLAFEACLRAGDTTACLLTPTATMAEHIRHSLARQDLLVRPDSIVTLSRFVEPLVRDIPQATTPLLDYLTAQHLASNPPDIYAPLAHAAGLRRTLVHLIEEFSTASRDRFPDLPLRPAAAAFRSIYQSIDASLTQLGKVPRSQRLRLAAARLREQGHPWRTIFLHGFHAFTPAELDILDSLAPAAIFLTLPEWDGALESRRELQSRGFYEGPLHIPVPTPAATLLTAPTETHEVEEIARRILLLNSQGHDFRHIGVLLRRENPYAALLAATFTRFGIPARFYFPRTLDSHPAARFLFGLLDAVASNWDYEKLLPLIQSSYSGIAHSPETDRIDFELRARMPAFGFPPQLAHLPAWHALDTLRTVTLTPAEWANRLQSLRSLVQLPTFTDQVPHTQLLNWRELLSALDAFTEALQQTAAILPDSPLSLEAFTIHLSATASHIPIHDKDQRRNVVHVLDVYEARQWSLPIVFICGLLERNFPQYHSEHPILADTDREALRTQRIVLRTSSERQREESVLFDNAVRCATRELILSYPLSNSKGEESLPSFFLSRIPTTPSNPHPCAPQPAWPPAPLANSTLSSKAALQILRRAASTLSPTAIETYLQCPFQYLGRNVLRLKTPPVAPHERLDFLLQGTIIHDTLAETEGSPLFVEEIFSRRFDDACREQSLTTGVRTERVRLELHTNLRRFLESPPLLGAATLAVERNFKLKLDDHLRISGKIDRVANLPDRGLVVIDYKYSTRDRVRERIRSHDNGDLVQGGLYLWAAEILFKQNPAAMLYCGLRGEVAWAGWHLPAFGWEDIGESTDLTRLREIIDSAIQNSLQVHQRILAGEVQPAPANRKKCDWCDFRDTCRIELSATPARAAGAAE